jgi:hypothetical protein
LGVSDFLHHDGNHLSNRMDVGRMKFLRRGFLTTAETSDLAGCLAIATVIAAVGCIIAFFIATWNM